MFESTVLKQFQIKKNNIWGYPGMFIDLIYILKKFIFRTWKQVIHILPHIVSEKIVGQEISYLPSINLLTNSENINFQSITK